MKTTLQIQPTDYKRLADEELVYRYTHHHENAAVNYLFDRYAHLILGICMKHFADAAQAKDATNELFIQLLDDLKRYHIDHFKSWLFQYVKNYSILQANKTIAVANNATVIDTDMEFDTYNIDINTERMSLMLEEEIKKLQENERICMELFYIKGMNYAQIAGTTGWQLLQVKQLLQKGKHHLKIKLA